MMVIHGRIDHIEKIKAIHNKIVEDYPDKAEELIYAEFKFLGEQIWIVPGTINIQRKTIVCG